MARTPRGDAGAKVLEAAHTLFHSKGIHAVGVDTLAARAEVTKTALYANFGSKDQLVVAYLRERDRLWQQQVDRITVEHDSPRDRVLAVFDAYDVWLAHDGWRGCAFLNAAAEYPDPGHPVREVIRHHKQGLRNYLRAQVQRIDAARQEDLCAQLVILLEGAVATSVVEQAPRPIRDARGLADALLPDTLEAS
ncbi:TetR/AcrR family transcriptional regulator [Actinopolyspora erythraea]|uniref:TetR/AcrR family transcriptional regulator n=1 Tax=Actinopolyspora erythraea TaxID=414996 RepID=A0A223RT49_9ACTN|nr:TetR/AcrR family transcriptional regulator [Actinopolyspora erythraea]ASU79048.1 TetR/AcrR family transcriptional regulator [Actinopolyspora erythraea]